ncbi:hypothetical protein CSC94_13305 [Zhengella mangrovi]|uniref:Uncharacterized protein n=1 Tax=Zhengella mangrovi TaxID=1982044 RepID=A0A2G1QMF4_9HYPH|nr:hypothetical protein [Zhengella mangrovi]PHP66654.1 hypothetical protein CSC94_13305 [Zhengella mangrovi]
MKSVFKFATGVFALVLLPCGAMAQSMSPMRAEVQSFTDSFAVRVYPANPYQHRIRIEVKVYDQHFNEIRDAVASPSVFTLGSRFARPVTVMVPFDGEQRRKVRICTESVPFPGQTTRIKAQVCGKFLGKRL